MDLFRGTAAKVAGGTLAGIGALHIAWGRGSGWPMPTMEDMLDATTGSTKPLPPTSCYVIGAALIGAGAVVWNRKWRSWPARLVRSGLITGLAVRGMAGGNYAAEIIQKAEPSERFKQLDRKIYQPLCLGLSVTIAFARPTKNRK